MVKLELSHQAQHPHSPGIAQDDHFCHARNAGGGLLGRPHRGLFPAVRDGSHTNSKSTCHAARAISTSAKVKKFAAQLLGRLKQDDEDTKARMKTALLKNQARSWCHCSICSCYRSSGRRWRPAAGAPDYLLPSPLAVARRLIRVGQDHLLWPSIAATLKRVGIRFAPVRNPRVCSSGWPWAQTGLKPIKL